MTAGWTPVATVERDRGEYPYEVAEHINGVTGDDPVFVEELYGDVYLAYWDEDADWEVLMEFEDIEEDRYLDITDDLAERLGAPDGDYSVVQTADYGSNRQLVKKSNGE